MSLKKSYAVFGLGRYGLAVARELVAGGADVLAIDQSAFIVVSQVSEVNGRGFTLEKIAEK